jgi:magnesium transporter
MIVREFELGNTGKKWIDIENPNLEDFKAFCIERNLEQTHIDDCLQSDHLPKFEEASPLNFIVTRAIFDETEEGNTIQEISTKLSFFIDDNHIITIHRLPHQFIEDIIGGYIHTGKAQNTHDLAVKLIKGVLRTFETFQNILALEIDAIEDQIFLKNSKNNFLETLYYLKRKSSIGKKLILLTREVLSGIKTHHKTTTDLRDAIDLQLKLELFYDQLIEDVSNLLTIYISVSSQKTNEVMKVLTIFSVFFMPLTFLVGIYGMNFQFMPELSSQYGYIGVWIAMLLVSAVVWNWFKRRNWL